MSPGASLVEIWGVALMHPKIVKGLFFVLPVSMTLLLFRFIQSAVAIWTGKSDRLVASHEVEDEIEDARAHVEGAK